MPVQGPDEFFGEFESEHNLCQNLYNNPQFRNSGDTIPQFRNSGDTILIRRPSKPMLSSSTWPDLPESSYPA